MSNDEWAELLEYVDGMVAEMEALPLPDVKDRVFELLAGVDSIHREAIHRLVRLFKKGVLEQVITDPPIRTLLELYDIVPATEQDNASGLKPNFPNIPIKVESTNAVAPKPPYPHWVPALKHRDDLPSGSVIEIILDDQPILLCRADDEFFALDSSCSQDGNSLSDAKLNGYTLSCPSHSGCLYDIRQGTRIAASGSINCYPIQLAGEGKVMVGFDMDFKPNLPSF